MAPPGDEGLGPHGLPKLPPAGGSSSRPRSDGTTPPGRHLAPRSLKSKVGDAQMKRSQMKTRVAASTSWLQAQKKYMEAHAKCTLSTTISVVRSRANPGVYCKPRDLDIKMHTEYYRFSGPVVEVASVASVESAEAA